MNGLNQNIDIIKWLFLLAEFLEQSMVSAEVPCCIDLIDFLRVIEAVLDVLVSIRHNLMTLELHDWLQGDLSSTLDLGLRLECDQ